MSCRRVWAVAEQNGQASPADGQADIPSNSIVSQIVLGMIHLTVIDTHEFTTPSLNRSKPVPATPTALSYSTEGKGNCPWRVNTPFTPISFFPPSPSRARPKDQRSPAMAPSRCRAVERKSGPSPAWIGDRSLVPHNVSYARDDWQSFFTETANTCSTLAPSGAGTARTIQAKRSFRGMARHRELAETPDPTDVPGRFL